MVFSREHVVLASDRHLPSLLKLTSDLRQSRENIGKFDASLYRNVCLWFYWLASMDFHIVGNLTENPERIQDSCKKHLGCIAYRSSKVIKEKAGVIFAVCPSTLS